MSGQALADGIEAVGCHACDVLRCVGSVGQGEGDGKGDEVDVGDVDEELSGIEGELAETPGLVDVWVCWIGYGWFDEGGTRVEKKGQSFINGEPDAASSKVRDSNGYCITRSA